MADHINLLSSLKFSLVFVTVVAAIKPTSKCAYKEERRAESESEIERDSARGHSFVFLLTLMVIMISLPCSITVVDSLFGEQKYWEFFDVRLLFFSFFFSIIRQCCFWTKCSVIFPRLCSSPRPTVALIKITYNSDILIVSVLAVSFVRSLAGSFTDSLVCMFVWVL